MTIALDMNGNTAISVKMVRDDRIDHLFNFRHTLERLLKAYYLRKVPTELWVQSRIRARLDGYTIRMVIIRLLRRYVKGEIEL